MNNLWLSVWCIFYVGGYIVLLGKKFIVDGEKSIKKERSYLYVWELWWYIICM